GEGGDVAVRPRRLGRLRAGGGRGAAVAFHGVRPPLLRRRLQRGDGAALRHPRGAHQGGGLHPGGAADGLGRGAAVRREQHRQPRRRGRVGVGSDRRGGDRRGGGGGGGGGARAGGAPP